MGTPIPIRVPSTWFLTTSTDSSSSTSRPLQVAADPGVHLVSFCRETEFPVVHLLPFEAFPPPTATATGTNPGLRGPVSPWWPFPTLTFTASLALSPFLFRDPPRQGTCHFVPAKAEASGPCSIVGSVACSAVSSRSRSVLPWACPIQLPRSPLCDSPLPCPIRGGRGSCVSEPRLLMNRRYVEDTPKSGFSA